ncbi:MATE efflux family protein (plasmid) [Deinococcus geothermalis DSM 11300]|uniref:Multidrug-efflux transporter n=1 Tax=Deinococcus geothermalis (strain DSM 11300 / CIP 105573 / AG-3a) TaxID=319795 RepID=Q1J3F8_DEIGD|nr:MATE family efflux transporter [Deinococcus geothermalis]ABF43976.1 MATE efflux family protein [Deinococcus geothermalis DSM 11300]
MRNELERNEAGRVNSPQEAARSVSVTRDLLLLAWPAITENLLQSAMGFADSFFVSRLGLEAVAAVGVSNALLQVFFAVFLAVATASGTFSARATGAKDAAAVQRATVQALWLAALVGLICGLLALVLAGPLLTVMGAAPEVRAAGETYFRIVAVPSVVIAVMSTAGAVLRGAGDTRAALRAGLWMNAAHVVLDPLLIFGLGFSGLGLVGAGVATVLARLLGAGLLLARLRRAGTLPSSWRGAGPDWGLMRRMSRLSVPTALERLAMRFGQIVYFGLILRLGTEVYAAHTLTGNFTLFASVAGTGLAAAISARVGQRLGAGDEGEARRYALSGIWVSSVLMTALALLAWVASFWGASLFTSDARVVALIVLALGIDVLTQPATGVVTALTATLQAGGDTRFPMWTTLVGIWGVRTVGVYLLGVRWGLGLAGVWLAILLDNSLRAFALWLRYRSGRWIQGL